MLSMEWIRIVRAYLGCHSYGWETRTIEEVVNEKQMETRRRLE